MNHVLRTAVIGIIATVVMDGWGVLREPLFGFPRVNYRLIGRWFANMPRGKFRHTSIVAAPSRRGEHAIGWIAHYTIGIAFAWVLVQVGGDMWLQRPTLGLSLLVGLGTLAAPVLVMQPAFGAGIAARRTAKPRAALVQSALTHLVYAIGLYAGGWFGVLVFPPAR